MSKPAIFIIIILIVVIAIMGFCISSLIKKRHDDKMYGHAPVKKVKKYKKVEELIEDDSPEDFEPKPEPKKPAPKKPAAKPAAVVQKVEEPKEKTVYELVKEKIDPDATFAEEGVSLKEFRESQCLNKKSYDERYSSSETIEGTFDNGASFKCSKVNSGVEHPDAEVFRGIYGGIEVPSWSANDNSKKKLRMFIVDDKAGNVFLDWGHLWKADKTNGRLRGFSVYTNDVSIIDGVLTDDFCLELEQMRRLITDGFNIISVRDNCLYFAKYEYDEEELGEKGRIHLVDLLKEMKVVGDMLEANIHQVWDDKEAAKKAAEEEKEKEKEEPTPKKPSPKTAPKATPKNVPKGKKK